MEINAMLVQPHFSEMDINVHHLLNDLQFIDSRIKDLKADFAYIQRLLEYLDKDLSLVRKEALCQK